MSDETLIGPEEAVFVWGIYIYMGYQGLITTATMHTAEVSTGGHGLLHLIWTQLFFLIGRRGRQGMRYNIGTNVRLCMRTRVGLSWYDTQCEPEFEEQCKKESTPSVRLNMTQSVRLGMRISVTPSMNRGVILNMIPSVKSWDTKWESMLNYKWKSVKLGIRQFIRGNKKPNMRLSRTPNVTQNHLKDR